MINYILASWISFFIFFISLPVNVLCKEEIQHKKEQNNKQVYKVEIVLKNGSSAIGKIHLKKESILILTTKNNFDYKKIIELKNLKSVEFVEWQAKPGRNYSSKCGKKLFYFFPNKILLTFKDKQKYVVEKRIALFETLKLTNQYGETKVYSYFTDLWIQDKDGKGMWHQSGCTNFYSNKVHDTTIIKLNFLEEEKKDEKVPDTKDKEN